ncbi:MAG: 50S ribosomal protein L9, partial [Bacteroidales bacterium]|nr:50S ribosomal protein L9 [Bacteroidales bacterium]
NGYANNYLIPQGMAVMATAGAKKMLAETLKQRAFKAEKIKQEAEAVAAKLNGLTVRIAAKAGASSKIFGSVNAIQIADALKEQHQIEIDRKKIMIVGDAIKETGTHTANINLHREVKAEITLDVYAE